MISTFLHIEWDSHCAKDLVGEEFSKCVQEHFLKRYMDGATSYREGRGSTLDLLLGTEIEDMTEVSMQELFRDFIRLKLEKLGQAQN